MWILFYLQFYILKLYNIFVVFLFAKLIVIFSQFSLLEIARIGEGKKIFQLEYISEEHLLVVVSGKQRQVRLVPIRALDGDETEWIKVAESKGCSVLTVGPVLRAPLTFCLCVAVKKQVC